MSKNPYVVTRMEGWERELVNVMHDIFQTGVEVGQSEEEFSEWMKGEIKIAYEKGFKEGQETVIKAYENSSKKVYEG